MEIRVIDGYLCELEENHVHTEGSYNARPYHLRIYRKHKLVYERWLEHNSEENIKMCIEVCKKLGL